jgi:hypothetical protein
MGNVTRILSASCRPFLPIHFNIKDSRIKELPVAAQVTVKKKRPNSINRTVINYTLGMSGSAFETLEEPNLHDKLSVYHFVNE